MKRKRIVRAAVYWGVNGAVIVMEIVDPQRAWWYLLAQMGFIMGIYFQSALG